MRERGHLEKSIADFNALEQDLGDTVELIELGEAEDDNEVVEEAEVTLYQLQKYAETQELQTLLSGEADTNDCFVEVNAGAGGTESQDWAQMLLRMYSRWSESHGYKVELMDESAGEEAGIKSASMRVHGHNAYGWLKTESGVHRLVRISPYDSSARRHTSFASVWVYPEIDDDIEVDVDPSDLRIDTYRSQGAGGQHVNTTDSAIRITHLPSGIVVACQSDRSQHRNRAEAMRMLRARLYEAELRRREEAAQAQQDAKTDIGWGHQIRSYVLHPYQMVKDLRTEIETSNTQGVLDGGLDDFMAASLAQRVGGGVGGVEAGNDPKDI
jgi:peptide chain release factor 2